MQPLFNLSNPIDPIKLARQNSVASGNLDLNKMPRLLEDVIFYEQNANCEVRFKFDEHGYCIVEGSVSCSVGLTCQRCLEPLVHNVHSNFSLSPVVNNDKAKTLPKEYDPILTNTDGTFDLLGILEDEILLSLPIVPTHDPDKTTCTYNASAANLRIDTENKQTHNPFSVLLDTIK